MADTVKSSHDVMPGLWLAATIGTAIAAFSSLGFFMDTQDRGYSHNHASIPEQIDKTPAFELPLILASMANYTNEYCKHQTYMCVYVNMDFKPHHDPSSEGYEPLLYVSGFVSVLLAAYHTYRIFMK